MTADKPSYVKWSLGCSRRQLFWEALVEVHDGKACDICGTPAATASGLVGPVRDPAYTYESRRSRRNLDYPTLKELTGR